MEAPVGNPRTLIIGLGNPLMGEDAFGPRVIERLLKENPASIQQADLADSRSGCENRNHRPGCAAE
jgi:Ni,Fe-hydrogenase maturation factor